MCLNQFNLIMWQTKKGTSLYRIFDVLFTSKKFSTSRSYPCSIFQFGPNHALFCITTVGAWYIFWRRLYTMPPMLPTHSRSWGDTSPLLFPVQSLHNMHNTTDTTFLVKQKEDKLPHDASVFVGRWDYPYEFHNALSVGVAVLTKPLVSLRTSTIWISHEC